MRYFFDTEFIEDGKTIDLMSIGIVAEDGRTFYYQSKDCDHSRAGWWIRKNVIRKLEAGRWLTNELICDELIKFIGDDRPEFWAYYGSYDWVALCQLFGRMMDLPENFPKYVNDLKQLTENNLPRVELPVQTTPQHHALNDALWVRDSYLFLQGVGNV